MMEPMFEAPFTQFVGATYESAFHIDYFTMQQLITLFAGRGGYNPDMLEGHIIKDPEPDLDCRA